jgi:hypothetical protein
MAFLGAGIVLGLSAGISPGPLLALVLSHTIRHGVREGFRVAAAPLLTDLPIILVSTLVLSKVAAYGSLLGAVSLAGAAFLVYMSYETFRARRQEPPRTKPDPGAPSLPSRAVREAGGADRVEPARLRESDRPRVRGNGLLGRGWREAAGLTRGVPFDRLADRVLEPSSVGADPVVHTSGIPQVRNLFPCLQRHAASPPDL